MKKIAILMLSICLLVAFSVTPAMAAKPAGTGFDQDGVNYQARVFNGWLEQLFNLIFGPGSYEAPPAWFTVKWSKDWTWGSPWLPPDDAHTAVGAWVTAHATYYLTDGWHRADWVEKDVIPADAAFKVEEFQKVMKVNNNLDGWYAYQAGGAINMDEQWGCGNYTDTNCPKYVQFQYTTAIYQRTQSDDWELWASWENCTTSPKGLGHPIF